MNLKSSVFQKLKQTKGPISLLILFLTASVLYAKLVEAKNINTKDLPKVTETTEAPKVTEEKNIDSSPVAETPSGTAETAPTETATNKAATASKTSTPAKAPASTNTSTPSESGVSTALNESGINSQINYQRKINGLGSLVLNSQLSSAATAKAKHMSDNNYFAHTAPDGTDDFYFVNNSGYRWTSCGVNIAMGSFGDAKKLVDSWMASPGHRANILASYGKNVGIGIYGKYFVMIVAN